MPMLYLVCKTCDIEFASGFAVDKKSFETMVLTENQHTCPEGHTNVYDGKDYYFRSNSRYFVKCGSCGEKIYVNFAPLSPNNREAISGKYPNGFTMKCSLGHEQRYQASDVFTEYATIKTIMGGVLLGSLGFLISSASGALFTAGGLFLAMNEEVKRVNSFNRS